MRVACVPVYFLKFVKCGTKQQKMYREAGVFLTQTDKKGDRRGIFYSSRKYAGTRTALPAGAKAANTPMPITVAITGKKSCTRMAIG
jgi:hypothetical protein